MPEILLVPILIAMGVLGLFLYLLVFYDNGHSGFAWSPPAPRADESRAEGSLQTVFFHALDGTRLEGWLFLPRVAPAPLVLMAPGLTGTKEAYLEPFAWKFVERGMAVLLFDFRCLGGSDGEPRHWVELGRHVADYEAAIVHAKELAARGWIDAERIALWGSSFSGGSALVTAARHPEIRAVVAQVPYLATPESQEPTAAEMRRYVVWTTLDLVRSRLSRLLGLRLPPVYAPTFGKQGEIAMVKSRENFSVGEDPRAGGCEFWRRLPPSRGGWENKLLARGFASMDEIVPLKLVPEIRCPLYLIAANDDDMVPLSLVEKAYQSALNPHKKFTRHACGHFDVYLACFEKNAPLQADFLAEHLGAVTDRP